MWSHHLVLTDAGDRKKSQQEIADYLSAKTRGFSKNEELLLFRNKLFLREDKSQEGVYPCNLFYRHPILKN